MKLPRLSRAPLRPGISFLFLLAVAGCEDMRFGYQAPTVTPLEFEAANPTSQVCLDRLADDDAHFSEGQDEHMAAEAHAELLSRTAASSNVRHLQTRWDHRYCVQRTNCLTLDRPEMPAPDVSDYFERCMDHRAQMRVRYNL